MLLDLGSIAILNFKSAGAVDCSKFSCVLFGDAEHEDLFNLACRTRKNRSASSNVNGILSLSEQRN
jgi:hypothetical protein